MRKICLFICIISLFSCNQQQEEGVSIEGTWELQYGVIIKENDTVLTNYTQGQRLIKIINESHFSFLRHDLNKGKDSTNIFIAGGGSYSFDGKNYKENLEFCTGRSWEGKEFTFQMTLKNDTLIQRGLEKNEEIGIDQEIIETYIRTKK